VDLANKSTLKVDLQSGLNLSQSGLNISLETDHFKSTFMSTFMSTLVNNEKVDLESGFKVDLNGSSARAYYVHF